MIDADNAGEKWLDAKVALSALVSLPFRIKCAFSHHNAKVDERCWYTTKLVNFPSSIDLHVNKADDVWALGASFYYLCMGKPVAEYHSGSWSHSWKEVSLLVFAALVFGMLLSLSSRASSPPGLIYERDSRNPFSLQSCILLRVSRDEN
jgi:hypothetical protein